MKSRKRETMEAIEPPNQESLNAWREKNYNIESGHHQANSKKKEKNYEHLR